MRLIAKRVWSLLLWALVACCSSSALSSDPPADEIRYVIDQDDGTPIAGAIVVATWNSTFGPHGAPACNRLESYVSGRDGGFRIPVDPKKGVIFLGAYKHGYARGNYPRGVQMASDGDPKHYQVAHYKWNESNTRAVITQIEPTIYIGREAALKKSRQNLDAFLRRVTPDRESRLNELHRLRVEGSCVGQTLSTAGAVPFYEAIYDEQVQMGDSQRELDFTLEFKVSAAKRVAAR
jgi:hypothetical protein